MVTSIPTIAVVVALVVTMGGSATPRSRSATGPPATTGATGTASHRPPHGSATTRTTNRSAPTTALPGMPRVLDPSNIYSADGPGDLSPVAKQAVPMIYVPNGLSNTVTEINPTTFQVVRTFPVGALPQHVVPSFDEKTLWVTNDYSNSLTPINPDTGLPGAPVPVEDPYNLYFTPNGADAIVVAEALNRLDFRDPHTMALVRSLPVPCNGIDHLDFSADGTYLIAGCEISGQLVKVSVVTQQVVGTLTMPSGSEPQDVKLSPDGKTFYVADLKRGGVWELNGDTMQLEGFIPTGGGAHGLYVSRDAKYLYVADRDEGSVAVISFATNQVVAKWSVPGGSPDMGNVSVDGKVLWLSGRYNAEVYAIDTTTGHLLARIPVGQGPHGLCVWPQPGRYSLGHTGIMR
ncbi:MAG: beta-propeller fold lactonase family protein [Acidimicrobiales bacterium]|nr:beta-propeller fold lactonase family protein [Acidimicrobiales bacterium]